MLTTKFQRPRCRRELARAATRTCTAALAVLILAGCLPAGPRALLEGRRLLEQERYEDAIRPLQAAASLLRTNAEAWNSLGVAYHYAGQVTNAAQAYRQALDLNKDLAAAHFNLGCLWLEQNRLEAARAELMTYTLSSRNSTEGWVRLGLCQLRSGKAAAGSARQADFAAAEKSYAEALKLNPNHPEAWNGLGLVQAYRNAPHEAARCFGAALKSSPDYGPTLLNLAIVSHVSLNNKPLALQKYRQYLALPARAPNWNAVNTVMQGLERELNPPRPPDRPKPAPPPAGTPRPGALTHAPRPQAAAPEPKASEPAAKPAQVSPAGSRPAAPLASVTKNASPEAASAAPPARGPRQDTNAATRALPESVGAAVRTSPGSMALVRRYAYRSPARPAVLEATAAERVMFERGLQAQQAERYAEAMQAYRQAAEMNPGSFDTQYNLALAAASAGNLPQALAAGEMALAIRPDSADARYNFALALKQSGYVLDAAVELERLLARRPEDVRAHLALGNLYASTVFQQPAKAREHYLRVLASDPRNPQAAAIREWLATAPP